MLAAPHRCVFYRTVVACDAKSRRGPVLTRFRWPANTTVLNTKNMYHMFLLSRDSSN